MPESVDLAIDPDKVDKNVPIAVRPIPTIPFRCFFSVNFSA